MMTQLSYATLAAGAVVLALQARQPLSQVWLLLTLFTCPVQPAAMTQQCALLVRHSVG